MPATSRFSSAFLGIAMAASVLAASANASAAATSREIASALVQAKEDAFVRKFTHQYEVTYGYGVSADMACGPGVSGYAFRCEVKFRNSVGSNPSASLQFMIYDRNIDFKSAVASMKLALSRQWKFSLLGQDGTYQKTAKNSSGVEVDTPIPGDCEQPISQPKGDAICAFEPDPRILMITIVHVGPSAPRASNAPALDMTDLKDCRLLAVVGQTYLDSAREVLDAQENVADTVKRKLDRSH